MRYHWRFDTPEKYQTMMINYFRLATSEALVRKDDKYFIFPEHKIEQLFNIKGDSHERNDLANDPAHAEKLAKMRNRFQELRKAAHGTPTLAQLVAYVPCP